jgi:Xaa-Pro dipeptidase
VSLLERQERAREIVRATGCDALLATDPGNVWWLTGTAVDIETGPSPFAPAPIAVLAGDDRVRLIVSDDQAPQSPAAECELITYPGFTTGPLRGFEAAREIVADALSGRRAASDAGADHRRLANAPNVLDSTEERASVRDALLAARATKDSDEIDALRAALRACDAGQHRLRELAAPGVTEIELFGAVRAAIEYAAGARTPLLADLVSGERTGGMGGPPTTRALAEGDLVLCDLAPRVAGVWADSCATLAVGGEARRHDRQAHARVRAALDRALDRARPGVRAGELDAAVRLDLGYRHHTGHGIGGSYYEQPRVVPAANTVLAPGMVIAIEPGLYNDNSGIRLEHVLLITTDGAEDLSGHSLALEVDGG